ncbi:hypothetical protein SYNPS1DRAFT_27702 [Syncephalis pseudoplumigaleata]|uniref:Uncharacterized protein n=1 Tax=Syncephalis pseudoplumigaleata TaxID=1712513 RepID=A0A4P9Z2M9_9FUNG|nr:hypothetical protein SYNPS1DRAFT_27702 [Syncephalis pseudoplumigaleata]|eukprot:RKP26618.1 hypothetical protein SYNPS1DRAFT_27702 [Syncephalis pseudoplumigaleata]
MLFPLLAQAILNTRCNLPDTAVLCMAGICGKDSSGVHSSNEFISNSHDDCEIDDDSDSDMASSQTTLLRRRHIRRLKHVRIKLELPKECASSLGRHKSSPAPLARDLAVAHRRAASSVSKVMDGGEMPVWPCRRRASIAAAAAAAAAAVDGGSCPTCGAGTGQAMPDNARFSMRHPNEHARAHAASTATDAPTMAAASTMPCPSTHATAANVGPLADHSARRKSLLPDHLLPSSHAATAGVPASRRHSVSSVDSGAESIQVDLHLHASTRPCASGNRVDRPAWHDASQTKLYGSHLSADMPGALGLHLARSPLSSTFYESFLADAHLKRPSYLAVAGGTVSRPGGTLVEPVTPRTEFFTHLIQSMTGEEQFAIRSGGMAMAQRHVRAARRRRY